MKDDKISGPVLIFLVGYGALLMTIVNGIYDSLIIEHNAYISWFAALIFGGILMPIGFYYTLRKRK